MTRIALWISVFALVGGCAYKSKNSTASQLKQTRGLASESNRIAGVEIDERRGHPSEYDPGAPKNSRWLELYGSAPNYRKLGNLIMGAGEEKFRWMFGPMWYRGRLGRNQVKAFVVGQEGAQDENISNRAFTGSTGTKTQNFLNHLGLNRSYLFMNTFVYTINGQLSDDPNFKWMEQGEGAPQGRVEDSPIVKYRHQLFDYMMEQNAGSIALFMGVGSGGKASLATWVNARKGTCSPARDLENCKTEGLRRYFNDLWACRNQAAACTKKLDANGNVLQLKDQPILAIGVPHPGGANPNLGGDQAYQNIKYGFTRAAQRVGTFKKNNPSWLDPDDKTVTLEDLVEKPYVYRNAPVPFYDFAFGTNWRMGKEGTSSNRYGADSIQVFSDQGEYSNKCHPYSFPEVNDSVPLKAAMKKGAAADRSWDFDYPWEPPRWRKNEEQTAAKAFDYGPCGETPDGLPVTDCLIQRKLTEWPNFWGMTVAAQTLRPKSHSSFGYSGIYRGNLRNPELVIFADQDSHDDMFSGRALTGFAGQHLQNLLDATNVRGRYLILRTLPVDTLGMPLSDQVAMATAPQVKTAREEIFKLVAASGDPGVKMVIALGRVAEAAVAASSSAFAGKKLEVLRWPSIANHQTQWNEVRLKIAAALTTQSKEYDGKMGVIAREDLPFHTRWWMGSSGSRGGRCSTAEGNYYRVWSPRWMSSEQPPGLSEAVFQETRANHNRFKQANGL